MLKTERTRPGPERTEEQKAAMLLVGFPERRGRVVLGQATVLIQSIRSPQCSATFAA